MISPTDTAILRHPPARLRRETDAERVVRKQKQVHRADQFKSVAQRLLIALEWVRPDVADHVAAHR